MPSVGNTAFEMLVNGKNASGFPQSNLAEYKAKADSRRVRLLAPWANRLDEDGFWAQRSTTRSTAGLKNYRTDGNNHPIHGLVTFAYQWKVVDVKARRGSGGHQPPRVLALSRLHGAVSVRAHALHDLPPAGWMLEVQTTVENHCDGDRCRYRSASTLISTISDARALVEVRCRRGSRWCFRPQLVPTGETKASAVQAAAARSKGVGAGRRFHGTDPEQKAGRADFWRHRNKAADFGAVWSQVSGGCRVRSPGRDFICFEPMSGPTNAFNLNHAGKYPTSIFCWVAPGARASGSR